MTNDDQTAPQLTNSGVTDPGLDEPAELPPATSTSTGSTPFGGTTPLTSSGCSAMIADMAGGALTNSGLIVAASIEDAGGQAILHGIIPADVPLDAAIIDELVAAVQGHAVRDVLSARVRQILKHGYRPSDDAAMPLYVLPALARSMILDSSDLLKGPTRNLDVARRKLAKAAAVLLASIDRIALAIQQGGVRE